MEEIFESRYKRRMFYIIVILLLVVIFLTRFFLIPYWGGQPYKSFADVTIAILDKLFVTFLVTVAGTFLFFISSPRRNDKIDIIEPFGIGLELGKARQSTDIWYFSGGAGRFTRVVTIPELAKFARESNNHKTIKLQIIDPTNKELCSQYAIHRKGQRTAEKQKFWDTYNVRCQIYATIVSACIWNTREPLLEITVGLKNHFSAFRTDLSSTHVVITREDPKSSGLLFDNSTSYYASFKESFHQIMKQIRVLNLDDVSIDDFQKLSTSNIKNLLTQLGIFEDLTDENINKIIDYCHNPEQDWTKLKK